MSRFAGEVGYGEQRESSPHSGVIVDVVVERKLYGDVIRNTKQDSEGKYLNNDITVNNSISVVADPYATENYFKIRYVKWMGVRWKVTQADASTPPRILLSLGGPYNGPTP